MTRSGFLLDLMISTIILGREVGLRRRRNLLAARVILDEETTFPARSLIIVKA